MRPLRRVIILSGLAGLCLGAAVALEVNRLLLRGGDLPILVAGKSGDVTGSIGTGGSTVALALPLSDEQRGHIFDGIMKIHDAPVADVPAPETPSALPTSVALQELPASVTRDIPMVEGYKFVKLDDRILLVSPVDRTVVADMPRYHIILD
jgi:hypothetical protein